MSVFGPVERLFPESTEAKGVVGQFEAVLAAVSSPKFCTHTLEVDLLLAPAANGRGRRQESTHVVLPFERVTTVIQFWMCAKPKYHELNIIQCGSATKQIGASRETASVALAWTSEQIH